MPAAAATSDPRATATAVAVLRNGGNAVDAAVAAALVLYVVEPQSAGVGGDAFLIVVEPGRPPAALDGSGALPLGLTSAGLAADGLDTVPIRGGRTVTVPGALGLLDEAVRRYGSRPLGELALPAVSVAADGFEVRPSLAAAAARAAAEIGGDAVLGPLYVPGGEPVAAGDRVRNPALAECLRTVAADTSVLYGGPLGDTLIDTIAADGGYLTMEDLARHRTTEMELVSGSFAGHVVWELGPPTQGPAVVTAVEQITPAQPTDWAAVLEAVRDGMRTAGFDPAAIGAARPSPAKGDTTYVAVVDGEGRGASLITSVFGDFGSHLGVPALGGPIGNRATMLRALRRDPVPGAKPPHTTIPAAVTRDDGSLHYVLGVAGGFMQPQAQVQLLVRLLAEGMTPQEAIDAPRFKVLFGGDVAAEPGHPLLGPMPEAGDRPSGPEGYGGAQVVGWHGDRLLAGADARRGGHAEVCQ